MMAILRMSWRRMESRSQKSTETVRDSHGRDSGKRRGSVEQGSGEEINGAARFSTNEVRRTVVRLRTHGHFTRNDRAGMPRAWKMRPLRWRTPGLKCRNFSVSHCFDQDG